MSGLRWAVVGTGHMADQVAELIDRVPDAELVAVVGRTAERARDLAARYGATAHGTLTEALLESVDAVYIGSPNTSHAAHAAEALSAGKHVLCDKPLATDVADAEALFAIAAAAHVTLGVNLQIRRHPGVGIIRRWLEEGRVGRMIAVRASIAFGHEELVGWRADPVLAGAAALYNLGIHAIDTVLAVVDQGPRSVSCELRPVGAVLDRTAVVSVAFDDGTVASILASQELADDEVRIEVLGTAGRITWDGWMAPYRDGPLTLRWTDGQEIVENVSCPDAYELAVRHFTETVRSGGVPSPSPEEALQTVRVVEAARRSGRSGSTVAL